MKLFISILFCFIFFVFFSANAQPNISAYGCMSKTSPTRVYQQSVGTRNGLPAYETQGAVKYSEWTTQYDITTYPCVTWVPVSSNGCYLRSGVSSYSYTLGDYGYFTGTPGTNCPIDDYTLPMLAAVGGLSFFRIRKRP